ncbi:MAG TPA: HD domain-containing phosphohydrolase [Bryobacteraceae bacterium]|nr:HD domain-containing phosphohydrolase [Bryobacteraceae bacterium]
MSKRILFVDDDPRVLQAFERQFYKRFEIRTAIGPELGLQAIATDGPFAAVVSDLRMPGMNGIEFLTRVRQISPDIVRVMLTGDADLSAAMAAVNEGKIFQFLTKPCPSDMLTRTLESSLEQHRLITAERELLENTLRGSIGVLSEILGLVNPQAFSRAQRIRRYVQHIVESLNLPDRWQYELAAMVSQIGCVTVPPDTLEKFYKQQSLSAAEQKILSEQNQVGHNLLAKIPRLESVAQMVAQQNASWSEPSDAVKTGAQLLKVASACDEQVMRGVPFGVALSQMAGSREYHQLFVTALQRLEMEEAKNETRWLKLAQLKPGMIVAAGIYSQTGLLLLAKGQQVTDSAMARLNSFASLFGLIEPISVVVPYSGEILTPPPQNPQAVLGSMAPR